MSGLISAFVIRNIMRFFPPVVTGPIIISIGLILAPTAISNASQNWLLAGIALAVIIVCNIWGKGMVKIVPILLGVVISYIVALLTNQVDFQAISSAKAFALAPLTLPKFSLSAIITIMPIALATMMEHIGDMAAISATTGSNYLNDPGLHRTLLGDGLATSLSALGGGPANTTYGENTGVAILLSFFPNLGAAIDTVPPALIGGVSLMLYGMISAIGIRNVVENKVDFTQSRNLIIAAVILVSALGFNSIGGITFQMGTITFNLSGLAIAAIVGILLNALIPGNDYQFGGENNPENSAILYEE